MKKRKKAAWGRLCAMWGCLIFLSAAAVPAYGALAGSDDRGTESLDETAYTAADGNTVEEERLKDGIVEYDELGSLVHYGNLSIRQMTDSTERTKQDYQEIRDYLRTERDGANAEKARAKEENDAESYMEYASLEKVYSSAAKSYNEMIKRLDRYSANKSRLSAENEVWAAYQDWNNAEIALSGIKDSQDSICQNLYLLLGTDSTVSFAKIPPVSTKQLPEIDLEADIQKAVGNNPEIIAERDAKSAGTSAANKKIRTLDELEEKVRIKIEQLYEEVNHGKQAYDAAETGLAGAELQWKNGQSQYALGMLSYGEYLQKELQYLQKKLAFDFADLSLFQTLENYNWAVEGVMALE